MAKPNKASKWFHKLFRRRKILPPTPSAADTGSLVVVDANKHAVAVAAASAAVAEAALAAAHAAAEVVRLTSNAPSTSPLPCHVSRRWSSQHFIAASVKIQSAFRGYLARRALKALKGLVKLQALVRGHFVRKRSADMLRRLQALVRVQDRARAYRVLNSDSPNHEEENPRCYELCEQTIKLEDSLVIKRCGSITSHNRRTRSSEPKVSSDPNWVDNWVEAGSSVNSQSSSIKTPNVVDEKSDKVLEVDSWKPHSKTMRRARNMSFHNHQQTPHHHHIALSKDEYNRSFAASDYLARYCPNELCKPNASPSIEDVASIKSLYYFPYDGCTAESSPAEAEAEAEAEAAVCSGPRGFVSCRRSPKTPMRHEYSSRRSLWNGGYGSFGSPSYMANTESFRAKVRSQSVPRSDRGDDDDKHRSIKRSLHAFWQSKTSSKKSLDPFSNL